LTYGVDFLTWETILSSGVVRKARHSWGERFPQVAIVHPTLTEKIHSYRIATSEGPKCSMVKGHDESTR
jgi:hypothetical protein